VREADPSEPPAPETSVSGTEPTPVAQRG
jgi:hypothetical protein